MSNEIMQCPFCEDDIDGCCFCEHSGRIYVGEGYFFQNEQQVKESKGIEFLKDQDKKGVEAWPEMIEHFLHEENIPKWYKK